MSRSVVIAHHLVWTGYGHWLPNDPRGSGSKEVCAPALAELGDVHFGRKEVQPPGRVVRAFYAQAQNVLAHPLLMFTTDDFVEIATAFAEVVAAERYTCYACAIMPDHVHILIRKHRHKGEEMRERLQDASRERLRTNIAPADHPVWTTGGWNKFLSLPAEVRHDIGYIHDNPLKIQLPEQCWPFVRDYDNWPQHKTT